MLLWYANTIMGLLSFFKLLRLFYITANRKEMLNWAQSYQANDPDSESPKTDAITAGKLFSECFVDADSTIATLPLYTRFCASNALWVRSSL